MHHRGFRHRVGWVPTAFGLASCVAPRRQAVHAAAAHLLSGIWESCSWPAAPIYSSVRANMNAMLCTGLAWTVKLMAPMVSHGYWT